MTQRQLTWLVRSSAETLRNTRWLQQTNCGTGRWQAVMTPTSMTKTQVFGTNQLLQADMHGGYRGICYPQQSPALEQRPTSQGAIAASAITHIPKTRPALKLHLIRRA